ncbi:MAG: hypothetical protein WC760_14015 [Bacteroidia bacterium]|jgi:hypothetical protein
MINNLENLEFQKVLLENKEELQQYDMKNSFLTDEQKATVEAWYQFPIGIFSFTFFSCFAFLENLTVLEIIFFSYLFGIIVAIVNWKFLLKPLIFLGYIFGGNVSSIISIAFAVYFGFENNWILMILAIMDAIGLLGVASPSMWLYSFFSAGKIHPKYIFATRYFKLSE